MKHLNVILKVLTNFLGIVFEDFFKLSNDCFSFFLVLRNWDVKGSSFFPTK